MIQVPEGFEPIIVTRCQVEVFVDQNGIALIAGDIVNGADNDTSIAQNDAIGRDELAGEYAEAQLVRLPDFYSPILLWLRGRVTPSVGHLIGGSPHPSPLLHRRRSSWSTCAMASACASINSSNSCFSTLAVSGNSSAASRR